MIGREFYRKFKMIRDSLGLCYRFEILYDDGSQFLTISDHFYRRLDKWKGSYHLNGLRHDNHGNSHVITSYKELENLPCLVILAGTCRTGLSFPR